MCASDYDSVSVASKTSLYPTEPTVFFCGTGHRVLPSKTTHVKYQSVASVYANVQTPGRNTTSSVSYGADNASKCLAVARWDVHRWN